MPMTFQKINERRYGYLYKNEFSFCMKNSDFTILNSFLNEMHTA